ncbi:hypothetical protein KUTeg_020235 [Tegillarca granosa]|uniref:Sortilin N-terminal domain-containing protein n=1 Tax=Tegillarca granosa TaxID=220873 RepID=A0ABQ9E788_TEGGR|nr:hypothetical protein KUTeg_020235 [Tegillarca granosa]
MTWTMAGKLLLIIHVVTVFPFICAFANNVHNFEMRMAKINKPKLTEKSDVLSRSRRDTADAQCQKQENDFLQEVKSGSLKLEAKYKFQNETNFSMALAWAGTGGGIMIVTTEEQFGSVVQESNVYRSDDYGQTFQKCGGKVTGAKIRKHNGLQRNPHDSLKLYLIGTGSEKGSSLYITEDGGKSFELVILDFHLDGEIMVHPDKNHDTYLLASSSVMNTKAGSKSLKSNVAL